MKRTKKDLEAILATRIKITLDGQTVFDAPLEVFFHLQNFFKGQIPLIFPLPGNGGSSRPVYYSPS